MTPDEATEAPAVDESQDTPQPDNAEAPQSEDTPQATDQEETPDVNWQERYENLHPEYTRATQEAAQYRQIITAAQSGDPEALALLGYEAPEDEEPEEVDPDERVSQLEQYLAEKEEYEEQQRWAAAEQQWLGNTLDELQKKENVKFDEREQNLLIAYATANRLEDGQPDIEGAYKLLSGAEEAARERYLQSKKAAANVPVGSAGEKKFDFNDDDQRREAMALEVERALSAEES